MPYDLTRRRFLQATSVAAGAAAAASLPGCQTTASTRATAADSIAIIYDPRDPVATSEPAQWAMNYLQQTFASRGLMASVSATPQPHAFTILAAGPGFLPKNAPQSLHDHFGQHHLALTSLSGHAPADILAAGQDPQALVYGLTELTEIVRYAGDPLHALSELRATAESPATPIRSITRLFTSDVEDLTWYHDRDFWNDYLTMLVTNRFNRFNLALGIGYDFATGLRDTYFYFAYPFLVSPKGYNVRAVSQAGKGPELSAAERDRNLATLRFISDAATRRGLHFQLGLWTHAYQWTSSPNVNYVIAGLDESTHINYCRDSLELLLNECPNIKGVTFRVHGESGVAEGQYQLWRTIFEGIVRTGRKIEIDMHAKGMDQAMIDTALSTGLPVNLSPKFWAEHLGLPYHQAAIRQQEMPTGANRGGLMALSAGSRSFLRYGYGDLYNEERKYGIIHRVWPGTQRLLLWGDPFYAAEYARAATFAGSQGMEWMEPLSFKGRKGSGLAGGRGAYADASLRPEPTATGDWKKYLYTYRLWGRTLYNPATAAAVLQRQTKADWGPAAEPLQSALAKVSRILPLITTAHLPSAANNNYWPEIYQNMSLLDGSAAAAGPYTDTPTPRVFGTVSPLDPEMFSTVNQCAEQLLSGTRSGRYSPLEVAAQLEDWTSSIDDDVERARKLLNAADQASDSQPAPQVLAPEIRKRVSAEFNRATTDIDILSKLGQFFAAKFRAGIACDIYTRTGYEPARDMASLLYQKALNFYQWLAAFASGAYMRDITFGSERQLRGNWDDRVDAIEKDAALVEKYNVAEKDPSPQTRERIRIAMMFAALGRVSRPVSGARHGPMQSYSSGKSLPIEIAIRDVAQATVKLHYRHVNQAERFTTVDMTRQQMVGGVELAFVATIPADYLVSPFPLQYYFEIVAGPPADTQPVLHPGFGEDFTGQPYFVVRRA